MAHTNDTSHSTNDASGTPGGGAPIAPARLVASYTSGGHEADRTPSRNLFGFLITLTVLLVLTGYGIDAIFTAQANKELEGAANVPSPSLAARAEIDAQFAMTYGEAPAVDGKDKAFRIPFAAAKQLVLANPARFKAAPPPAGWKHPDDMAPAPAKPN